MGHLIKDSNDGSNDGQQYFIVDNMFNKLLFDMGKKKYKLNDVLRIVPCQNSPTPVKATPVQSAANLEEVRRALDWLDFDPVFTPEAAVTPVTRVAPVYTIQPGKWTRPLGTAIGGRTRKYRRKKGGASRRRRASS